MPRRAFSLVELLVSIGVIGVLLSILLPALGGARSAAGQVKSLANARNVALLIDSHAARSQERYPAARAGERYRVGTAGRLFVRHNQQRARFVTRHLWASIVVDVREARELWETWQSPGSAADGSSPDYYFSNSFVADPRLWMEGYIPEDTSVLRDVRRAEVQYPTLKAMVWDGVMAYLPPARHGPGRVEHTPMPIAFADLHAETRVYAEAAEAVPNPLNDQHWARSRLHNTPNGVHGRDY